MKGKKRFEHFEEVYKGDIEEIPWNHEQPPELLVELVESGQVKKGKALDLGCGLGNYVIWLAKKGFDVVGVDGSPTAIKIAKKNAKRKKVKCKFLNSDLTERWPHEITNPRIRTKNKSLISRGKPFDFVYDWGLLHHIMPEDRDRYIRKVHRVLKPKGKYASLCFNEKDESFEGTGKYRGTRLGTDVYLSSEKELRKLYGKYFRIIDFRVFESVSKITHVFNYCFMERKEI